jgi:hypothetical protein
MRAYAFWRFVLLCLLVLCCDISVAYLDWWSELSKYEDRTGEERRGDTHLPTGDFSLGPHCPTRAGRYSITCMLHL